VTGLRATRNGWIVFAAAVLLVAGVFNVIEGIVALTAEDRFELDEIVVGDLQAWGVFLVTVGAIQVGTAALVYSQRVFGQFLGIMVAGLNGFAHFLFIGAQPAWSIAIMVVDGLVIYALTVHGEAFLD
jgi:hypothetical protein